MVLVTKPFMPPIEEYNKFLEGIWDREWITNNGPLVQQLEQELTEYLGVDNLLFLGNGTIALQIAIKALELTGEVITTPFSYVATSTSIVWENCIPVFVDVDSHTFNIDADKIEAAISDKTSGILATHVFGNPCDVEKIAEIADKYNLKVIYDAAHCFGTEYRGKSIFNWGDISTASFHATKIYHTIEGGAVVSSNENLVESMRYMRNFGHDGPYKFSGIGINGKNSEFHAAMGLLNLRYVEEILSRRAEQFNFYREELSGHNIRFQRITDRSKSNFSYCPVIFDSEEILIRVYQALKDNNILARRYFYPSLNTLTYLEGSAEVSESISSRILCLPLYHELKREEQQKVISVIKENI